MCKTIYIHDLLDVVDPYTRIWLFKRLDWSGPGNGYKVVSMGRFHAYQMTETPNWPVVRVYHNHLADCLEVWYDGGASVQP